MVAKHEYQWLHLPLVTSCFHDKVEEINSHLNLLEKLLQSNTVIEYREPSSILPHKHRIIRKKLEPQETHPLKAGVILMIYNFIESISTNLMQDIFDCISNHFKNNPTDCKLNKLCTPLSEQIVIEADSKKILKETVLYCLSSSEHFDAKLINEWLIKSLEKRTNTTSEGVNYPKWFSGNVDVRKISKELSVYGFTCKKFNNLKKKEKDNISVGRPCSVKRAKNARNDLAHGSVSFVEYGRKKSLDEIITDFQNISSFFDGLLDIINYHLSVRSYLQN